MADIEDKQRRIEALRIELQELEQQVSPDPEPTTWKPGQTGYYGLYHATSGLLLGSLGALASLLFNAFGSLVVNQNALRLIQVYLTFPLGERALSDEFDTGMVLAVGCCLYVATGMILGIPFQMAFARFLPNANLTSRLVFATLLGLVLWAVNFYLIIATLQPLLFGGNWIVDPEILPPWVGAATHLVFAWTMAILYPWGKLEPYRRQTRTAASAA